jgi:hypothetical protein
VPNTLTGRQGQPTLFFAAETGRTEVVRYLLDHGAKVDVVDPRRLAGASGSPVTVWHTAFVWTDIPLRYPGHNSARRTSGSVRS